VSWDVLEKGRGGESWIRQCRPQNPIKYGLLQFIVELFGLESQTKSKSITLMIRFKDASGTGNRRLAARGADGWVKASHVLIDGKVVALAGELP
jgi:hypothetical protein